MADAEDPMIGRFEALLARGTDSALLRFALGQAKLKAGDPAAAIEHLVKALELDAAYSAAWKVLGQAQLAVGDVAAARSSFERGIEVATAKGDVQAAKEMAVFRKRLDRAS